MWAASADTPVRGDVAVVRAGVGRRQVGRLLVAAFVVAAQAMVLLLGPALSGAALAQAGTPRPAAQLFTEGFESNPVGTPVLLTDYTGTAGMRYTADEPWLEACNGNVVAFFMTELPPNCSAGPQGMENLRSLAFALGVLQGAADPTTNRALSAYTDLGNNTAVDPGPGLIQLQTMDAVAVPPHVGKRYVTFSVDVAAVTCQFAHPLLQFSLLADSTVIPVAGQIEACTDPRGRDIDVPLPPPGEGDVTVHVGTYSPEGSIAFTGSTLGVRLVNNEGSGLGNDAAIDNIEILDATPQLDKTFSPAVQVAGQPAQLTYTITNSAELASKLGWSFTDDLPAGMRVVAPAATSTCPNHVVTATPGSTSVHVVGDLDTNQPFCTVTVNVTAGAGHFVNGPGNVTPDGVLPPGTSEIDFRPVITLVKNGVPNDLNHNGRIDAGETISYTFTVANPLSNGVELSNVAVADPRVGPVTCPSGPLPAGESTECTATYTVTQADLNAGVVNNMATATASSPPGVLNPESVTANASTPLPASATITVEKSVDPTSVSAAGQQVTYHFDVTNTGNVTLTNVAVRDTDFSGTGTPPNAPCQDTTLDPGDSTTCTGTYTVTVADVNAGKVTNTAVATGSPPTGAAVTSPESSAQVTIPAGPALTVEKSVQPTSVGAAGQQVTYHFDVTNTGNVTLTNVAVHDTDFSGTGTPPTAPCQDTALDPGDSTTCTGTYTVTQADVNAGKVTNTAVATGTPPTGTAITSPDSSAQVTIPPNPALTVEKTAEPTLVRALGDVVTYHFKVTNTGNVTLTNVAVHDTEFSGTGTPPVAPCQDTTLDPGDSTTCTGRYTITQADEDAGTVTNTAVATGTPPSGPAITSPPSSAEVTIRQVSEITLTKTAGQPVDANGNGRIDAGDTIAYTFVVTNTGNVDLTHVMISDEKTGPVTCPTSPLAPGESTTCTTVYTITQADVDAGAVTNTGTATATPPPSAPPTNQPTATTTTRIPAAPGINLVKKADRTSFAAGDTIRYTFTATNTGNVTLTNVGITDTSFSGAGTLSPLACNRTVSTTVAPSLAFVCVATYRVTQADVNAGSIHNAATAAGTPPTGPAVTSEAALTLPAAKPILPPTGLPLRILSIVAFVLLSSGGTLLSVVQIGRRRRG
jgi:uncharacterized repeat protein (TIGR01451 family)